MEQYDLRACFLPDLSGLHVRIYQFRELLKQCLPELSNHLEDLQVDPAYVSQWFLSFFAVTCPLPMLFRIYDVIFAEGASETIMRVALSLMRKNEARLLAMTELEDVMQLLLSRGLWDCYNYNADGFVQDFVDLTHVVSRKSLEQLEQGYKESKLATQSQGRSSDITTTAATRFLGRIWASSTGLSPKSANSNTGLNTMRRSPSKQSLASTLNSVEGSSVTSSVSTEATNVSRDSSNTQDGSMTRESTPVAHKAGSTHKNDERYLHSQIEDLLMALSELQRNQALLSNQLQREREERQEDRKAVRSLLDGLRKKANSETVETGSTETLVSSTADDGEAATKSDEESAQDATDRSTDNKDEKKEAPSTDDLSELLDLVERRFQGEEERRRSSMMQTKAQLRTELSQLKDHLSSAMSQSQEFSRQLHDVNQELVSVKDQLRESHAHVRTLHQDKQRLERQIHTMKVRVSSSSAHEPTRETDSDHGSPKLGGGLREFKLGRSKSTPSQASQASLGQTPGYAKRISSLPQPHDSNTPMLTTTPPPPSNPENEALLSELVQAKTAEAIAKQEVEEMRQKLEALRKACGVTNGHAHKTSTASDITKPVATTAGSPAASGGGFWGWRR